MYVVNAPSIALLEMVKVNAMRQRAQLNTPSSTHVKVPVSKRCLLVLRIIRNKICSSRRFQGTSLIGVIYMI